MRGGVRVCTIYLGKCNSGDSTTTMNEELINSAVSFLQDASVAQSPLNKKVEFLQSKGLNEQEIEEAMKRANSATATSAPAPPTTYQAAVARQQAPLDYYQMPPAVPERTWKDYFIMATATAGVTYGLYQVVSRYLIPSIVPPGQARVDADKERIEEEFVKIDKVLEQMALEQKEVRDANEAKLKELDVVIANINDFLSKYNKDKLKFDDDLRLMKLEVDNLQNGIEKNMKLTKDNLHDELSDISDELSLLKNLIKARGAGAAAPERKVVPVLLIPSASEILKKAKAGSTSPAISPVPTAANGNGSDKASAAGAAGAASAGASSKDSSASPMAQPVRNGGVQEGNIKAAGIPDWQLKHREQELLTEKKDDSGEFWKQAMQQGNDEDVVEKNIQNVGVPAWQLSAGKE